MGSVREKVLLRGTYALYREVGPSPEGILFRYRARHAALPFFLICAPLVAIFLTGIREVYFAAARDKIWVSFYIFAGIFGPVALLLLWLMFSSLWSHREMTVDPATRRLVWRSRTPLGTRVIEREGGKVRGVTLDAHRSHAVWFVGIDLGDGLWIHLGQGDASEARSLAHRLTQLLGVGVLES